MKDFVASTGRGGFTEFYQKTRVLPPTAAVVPGYGLGAYTAECLAVLIGFFRSRAWFVLVFSLTFYFQFSQRCLVFHSFPSPTTSLTWQTRTTGAGLISISPVTKKGVHEPISPVTNKGVHEPISPATKKGVQEQEHPVTKKGVQVQEQAEAGD